MSELDGLPSWAAEKSKTKPDHPAETGAQSARPAGQETKPQLNPQQGQPVQAPNSTPPLPVVQQPAGQQPVRSAEQPDGVSGSTAATTAAGSAAHPDHQAPPRRRRGLIAGFALLGILALAGMGVFGYLLAKSQIESNATATTAEEDLAAPEATEDSNQDPSAETETDAGVETGAGIVEEENPTTSIEETESELAVDLDEEATEEAADGATNEGTPAEVAEPERQAVLRGQTLFLSGRVPNEQINQIIQAKAAAVMGAENVVNDFVIDPTSVVNPGDSAPIYVEDVVLFPFNSVEIDSAFFPILDLGLLLMQQNPQADLTIVSRTDAVGSEAVNLEVATKRAQALIDYLVSGGIDSDRLIADPRGEEGTLESDDSATSALNRRAEFIITGLLG